MKNKIITLSNIKNYIEGNVQMALAEMGLAEKHIVEQVAYRESKCPDCAADGKCMHCHCSLPGRWFSTSSCNDGDRFPALMSPENWEKFKEDNNLIFI